jgi:hypothetical protein
MTETIHLHKRLTHRYQDAWRYLDEERYIGAVKQLGATRIEPPQGYDDGGKYYFRIVAPTTLKKQNLRSAITSTLSGSGCRHDYDCCGCGSTSARVKRLTKREYSVVLSVNYNY